MSLSVGRIGRRGRSAAVSLPLEGWTALMCIKVGGGIVTSPDRGRHAGKERGARNLVPGAPVSDQSGVVGPAFTDPSAVSPWSSVQPSVEVEAVGVHHLRPRGDEVVHELLLR